MRGIGNADDRGKDEADSQSEDWQEVRAKILPGKIPSGRKKQRRQEDQKDEFGIESHLREARQQGYQESSDNQQNGKWELDPLGYHGQHADDAEKHEKGLDFLDHQWLGRMPDAMTEGQWRSNMCRSRNVLAWLLGQCIRCVHGLY